MSGHTKNNRYDLQIDVDDCGYIVNAIMNPAVDGIWIEYEHYKQIERQRDGLLEDLKKYGEHRPQCTFYPESPDVLDVMAGQCSCGFVKAIASVAGDKV